MDRGSICSISMSPIKVTTQVNEIKNVKADSKPNDSKINNTNSISNKNSI
jgi:hypothetical protein